MSVAPEINPRRAVFVLGKIDEILSWEKTKEQERDVRFVELGRISMRGASEAVLETRKAQLL